MPQDKSIPYVLDEQVGFILRQVNQRHLAIFNERMIADLTAPQFAVLAKLKEAEPCSQNHLGRLTSMDAATAKGVIDRMTARGFITSRSDPGDARRRILSLTDAGQTLVAEAMPIAAAITEATLAPLGRAERRQLLALLKKLRENEDETVGA